MIIVHSVSVKWKDLRNTERKFPLAERLVPGDGPLLVSMQDPLLQDPFSSAGGFFRFEWEDGVLGIAEMLLAFLGLIDIDLAERQVWLLRKFVEEYETSVGMFKRDQEIPKEEFRRVFRRLSLQLNRPAHFETGVRIRC